MAQKLSPYKLKLFGSPWVAPDWIKTNDTFNKIKGEIGGEYYQIWANYFVK
jgi:glucosylceramidase